VLGCRLFLQRFREHTSRRYDTVVIRMRGNMSRIVCIGKLKDLGMHPGISAAQRGGIGSSNRLSYQLFLIRVSKANPPLGSRVALNATRGET
jgi:hypothetical protein